MKKPIITVLKDKILITGHFDDKTLCAKLDLLCRLYKAKITDGFAIIAYNPQFLEDYKLIDTSLAFSCDDGGCSNSCVYGSSGCGCGGDCYTCADSCGDGCLGSCSGSCSGCSGTCSGSCSGSCSGVCENSCNYDCWGCSGSCYGSCSSCSGTCTDACTSCTGSCTGTCSSCTGTCSNTCTGSCTGSCTGTCTGTCTATCTGTCSACTGQCQGTCNNGCTGGSYTSVYNNLAIRTTIKAADLLDLKNMIKNEASRRGLAVSDYNSEDIGREIFQTSYLGMYENLTRASKSVSAPTKYRQIYKALAESYLQAAKELYRIDIKE